ncbi:MAG: hypothetical protein COT59_00455 [Candidatus Nealsonbacteria bacterium CG09_land_8_20_14_0_10_42_14]|uniref:Clp R domain-containing protein n=1 Tax=Candidatus Nealsonbacteria bacterium CG09_land_8_20_14_0_10_42_14 TaxID=1974707 RepID=A0A2H0WXY1_9BACT|nr:MAG: hypothetical protein COT59_00455 [Candidatus Nealsonbacteria bacterium CG09_land_8_20_14_0_10_42_14]
MDSKFYFDLKKARIYQVVKWLGNPVFVLLRPLQKLFFALFVIVSLLFFYGFLTESFPEKSNSFLLGLTMISLTLAVGLRFKIAFFNQKLKNPPLSASDNLAEFLDFEAARAVRRGKLEEVKLNFVFSRVLLDFQEIKKIKIDFQPEIILAAKNVAQKKKKEKIGIGDLLVALFQGEPAFKKILVSNNLRVEDIENLTWWLESLEKTISERKKWWQYHNLMKKGTLAKEWTAGYTLTLDKYSTDWTEIAKRQKFPEIIGHGKEIEQTERILGRREYNNVLLVGEPGVGRKGIVQGLVRKSVLGESLPDVNYKRVLGLDMPGLLAGLSDIEAIEAILDKIFQEAISAGNVVLVIDEFHNFISVKPGPGRIDISGIISSYLHLPEFQIVAVTTYAGLHKNLEQNPSILSLFEKVEVSEVSERETMMILENLVLSLEQKYKLFCSYPALREIVTMCRRFLPSLPFPKKAIDLLDEVMIYVKKSTRDKVVLPEHVAKIITEKTQVPVGEMEVKEKEVLLNLEKLIHQRIINQEEAVKEVSTALRRARAEVTVRKGPMGTFLFLGPTGVGKTETAKVLTQIYFGSEARIIRLDMSEFQDVKDIPRLIGSPGEEGLLTTQIIENPFSLILLDEIEKAHPNILNLFLQVLDEGFLTDGLGRKVDFKNSIIIATSNAGYQIILQALKEKTEWSGVKQKLLDYIFEQGTFRPEFINRFDAVVVFKPLSKENLLDIAELMLQSLKKNLQEKGIEFKITLPLKEKIVELGYDPTFGARAMRRVLQDKVENVLASALLSGELKRGDKAELDPPDFKLKINS